jgi:small-conductance mechanosensitive channel
MLLSLVSLTEIAAIIVGGIVGDRLTARLVAGGAKIEGVAKDRVRTARAWLRLPWIIVVVAGVAHVLGIVNELEALTVFGIIGVVITVMSEHTLGNIGAGLLLLIDDLVRLGDVVEVRPGMKGQVVKIGLTDVWFQGDEGGVIIVSNEWVRTGPFINYTALERLHGRFQKKPASK